MEPENEKDFTEKEFFDTFEFTFIVEVKDSSGEMLPEIPIVIFADTYPLALEKLNKIKFPYKAKDIKLESIVNYEPAVNTYIYTEVLEDDEDDEEESDENT